MGSGPGLLLKSLLPALGECQQSCANQWITDHLGEYLEPRGSHMQGGPGGAFAEYARADSPMDYFRVRDIRRRGASEG